MLCKIPVNITTHLPGYERTLFLTLSLWPYDFKRIFLGITLFYAPGKECTAQLQIVIIGPFAYMVNGLGAFLGLIHYSTFAAPDVVHELNSNDLRK